MREGGLFTIEIAEEDSPRRSRANRPLSSGRTVSQDPKQATPLPARHDLHVVARATRDSPCRGYH